MKCSSIARDSPKKLREFKQKNQITLPIYPDRKGSVVKSYNVFQSMKLSDSAYLKFRLAIPSTFLVNQNGEITWVYVGTREDRPSPELILRAIKENLPHVPS